MSSFSTCPTSRPSYTSGNFVLDSSMPGAPNIYTARQCRQVSSPILNRSLSRVSSTNHQSMSAKHSVPNASLSQNRQCYPSNVNTLPALLGRLLLSGLSNSDLNSDANKLLHSSQRFQSTSVETLDYPSNAPMVAKVSTNVPVQPVSHVNVGLSSKPKSSISSVDVDPRQPQASQTNYSTFDVASTLRLIQQLGELNNVSLIDLS